MNVAALRGHVLYLLNGGARKDPATATPNRGLRKRALCEPRRGHWVWIGKALVLRGICVPKLGKRHWECVGFEGHLY